MLTFSLLKEEDIHEFYQIVSKASVARYMRFDRQTSLEGAKMLLKEFMEQEGIGIFLDGILAGVLAKRPEREPGTFSISLFLDEPYWNRGIATRVMETYIKRWEQETGVHILRAYIAASNAGSRRVIEKMGFLLSGETDYPGFSERITVYQKKFAKVCKR